MPQTAQHTPTLWETDVRGKGTESDPEYDVVYCDADHNGQARVIVDTLNADFLYTSDERSAFCKKIVRCVNLHAELIEAVRIAYESLIKNGVDLAPPRVMNMLDSVLAKAEGDA
jgi:hypothetical protein